MPINQAEIDDLMRKFTAPLAGYASTSSDRKANADFMVRTLWTAMIAGPEMEEETWKAFREIGHLPEEALAAIQECHYQKMKPVVTDEELASLRSRYKVRQRQD